MIFKPISKILPVSLAIFIFVFSVYFVSNPLLQDNFKHQVYLAYSFGKGHCDLVGDVPGHHDIFEIQNKRYTAFSPFPILILAPLVKIFGQNTNQVLVSMVIGALNPVILFFILRKIKLSLKTVILAVTAFSFGTLNWYSSVIGTSWFFSHSIAVFSLLLALLFLLKRRLFISGLFFGFAVASRYPILVALPAMLWLVKSFYPKKSSYFVLFVLGCLPGLILPLWYNFCRFGNIFETGYYYANLAYTAGKLSPQFSLFYLPRNLAIFLFKGFDFITRFPFLKPDPQGLSIFFTSPFLLFAFKASGVKKLIYPFWLAIFSISLVVFSYFLTGWFQFGYRFLLDFLPFLIILVAFGMEKHKSSLGKLFLVVISIIFNLLGVYWGLTLKW